MNRRKVGEIRIKREEEESRKTSRRKKLKGT